MNIGFWSNQLCERGTTVSVYDYAYFNQTLLNNKSYIFYDRKLPGNKKEVIAKFEREFIVHETDTFSEVDDYIRKYQITHIYIIKAGNVDNKLSKFAKNCIHCVFTCGEPHGEIYSAISPWVYGNNGKFPVVPHMIHLPTHDKNMRKELHIPENAVVFGGYGGKDNLSIPFVHVAVYNIALYNPNIFFLFANFDRFCDNLPNIIHLPMMIDLEEKTRFINTTDAMLWARIDGEVMSIAMGEFSIMNKPIICMNIGLPGHVYLLGNKAIWYEDIDSLCKILLNFNPEIERKKEWNAYMEYTPENVMQIFKEVYLS
jgi:hypothetical protein